MEILLGIVMPLVMVGIVVLMLLVAAGPRNVPREGIDYFKTKHGHYNHHGTIVPFQPKSRPFSQRLADGDGLLDGRERGGRGADG